MAAPSGSRSPTSPGSSTSARPIAGRYLKSLVESGYDNGREMYTMTVDEVLEQAEAVVREAGHTAKLPSLPIINEDVQAERQLGRLPGDNQGPIFVDPSHPTSNFPTVDPH